MRRFLLMLFLAACCAPNHVFSQLVKHQTQTSPVADTVPLYRKYPTIPAFPLYTVDNKPFDKSRLKKNKPTVVFIFSVECDHCRIMTEEIQKNIAKFSNSQILMITPFKVDRMKEYYDEFKIGNYKNITMVSEPTRQIMRFYDLHYFPGVYIYDKKQSYTKGWEGGVKLETLLANL
ncbi:cytochrome oxidase Cu insertion factor (SCO1/SenC/PrrC family) [Chitinophaga skermanii]|uniref:Cytochrome oxidase Cu insertion factor (SCO1/SenC/PrrC family) n=1 Tax=Chitinophaga skermanii TaxID=331697 RepID=A0A327Q5N4_9BACT|nr:redoxin domain-containing protein [Chitinophaga skermanii]RAI99758.1 cytochrome oxidase Cu insertion factor (SCO1/SenC/PrrC family) [Chitinophaga skermanii]